MKLEFHGADRNVTGSCHLVRCQDKTILIDCGMYQGGREMDETYGEFQHEINLINRAFGYTFQGNRRKVIQASRQRYAGRREDMERKIRRWALKFFLKKQKV